MSETKRNDWHNGKQYGLEVSYSVDRPRLHGKLKTDYDDAQTTIYQGASYHDPSAPAGGLIPVCRIEQCGNDLTETCFNFEDNPYIQFTLIVKRPDGEPGALQVDVDGLIGVRVIEYQRHHPNCPPKIINLFDTLSEARKNG